MMMGRLRMIVSAAQHRVVLATFDIELDESNRHIPGNGVVQPGNLHPSRLDDGIDTIVSSLTQSAIGWGIEDKAEVGGSREVAEGTIQNVGGGKFPPEFRLRGVAAVRMHSASLLARNRCIRIGTFPVCAPTSTQIESDRRCRFRTLVVCRSSDQPFARMRILRSNAAACLADEPAVAPIVVGTEMVIACSGW
jgi:hypothetical protein